MYHIKTTKFNQHHVNHVTYTMTQDIVH